MGDVFNDLLDDHLRDAGWLTLNFAYIAYTASSIFKDMLRLRAALVIATVLYIAYGLVEGVWSIVLWNIPVGLIHLWRAWDLLRQRRTAQLDTEAEAIRVLIYRSLDRISFHELWTLGEERHIADAEVIITQATPVDRIMLILDGTVRIEADGRRLAELGRFRFIGEMSTLSGRHASASVIATGPVRVRSWRADELDELLAANADTERCHLRAVGRDLARKLA